MDQAFETLDTSRQDGTPDYTDFFEAEFASQELKVFQVATLFQEVERLDQTAASSLMDDALLTA